MFPITYRYNGGFHALDRLCFDRRNNVDCYCIGVSIGSACTADRITPSHLLLGMSLSEEMALSTIRLSMGTTTSRADMIYTAEVRAKCATFSTVTICCWPADSVAIHP